MYKFNPNSFRKYYLIDQVFDYLEKFENSTMLKPFQFHYFDLINLI